MLVYGRVVLRGNFSCASSYHIQARIHSHFRVSLAYSSPTLPMTHPYSCRARPTPLEACEPVECFEVHIRILSLLTTVSMFFIFFWPTPVGSFISELRRCGPAERYSGHLIAAVSG